MKKWIPVLLSLCCLLAACGAPDHTPAGSSAPVVTEVKPDATEAAVTQPSAPAPVTVSPLPRSIDLEHLDNCTVPISLQKGDVYLDDDGALQMKATAYTYDRYDLVDIANLKVGDTIVLGQENVTVTSVVEDSNGRLVLNGQFYLCSNEDGTFSQVDDTGILVYYPLGEATIRVSQEFTFADSFDPGAGTVTYYPGDFLTDDVAISYDFTPANTTLVIENGVAVSMNRIYLP